MTDEQIEEQLNNIPGWQLHTNGKMIYRDFALKNFMAAVDMVNRIAKIAEDQNHHPDLHLTGYRKLRVELTTHDAGGLSGNDFIQAAKINDLAKET